MNHFLMSVVIAGALTFGVQLLEFHGWLPVGKVMDVLLRSSGPMEVVLVDIDDDSYQSCFHSSSPLDPAAISATVSQLATTNARVIGVDIMTESAAYQEQLKGELSAHLDKVVWIAGVQGEAQTPGTNFFTWLIGRQEEPVIPAGKVLGFEQGTIPEKVHWSVPVYPIEDDAKLRRAFREVRVEGAKGAPVEERPGWARTITELRDHPEGKEETRGPALVYVKFRGTPRHYAVRDLWDCSQQPFTENHKPLWQFFESDVQGKVVLLGGSFAAGRDFYDTPEGRRSGLEINAQTVQAEMDRQYLHEENRLLAIALDLAIGIGLFFVFAAVERSPRRMLLGVAWSAVLIAAAGFWTTFLIGPQYLPGFIGIAMGVLVHQVIHAIELEHERKHHAAVH